MQIQHIGYQIRGFYRVAKIGHRWADEPSCPKTNRHPALLGSARHRRHLRCLCKVSRRTLYRWQQTLAQAGGDPAALTPRSRAPKRRRQAVFRREVVDEIRRLRKVRPNIGKLLCRCSSKPGARPINVPAPVSPPSDASSTGSPIRCATPRCGWIAADDTSHCAKPAKHAAPRASPPPPWNSPAIPWSASVMASDATSSPSSTPARASPSPGRPPPAAAAAPHTPCAPSSP